MDSNRFDRLVREFALVRELASGASRRTVLGFSLGGLAGAVNLWGTEAKKGKKGKKKCKKCGPCKICKKGKCKANKPDGTDCGGPCLTCQGGECVAKTGEACGDGQVCLDNGSCAEACTGNPDCPDGCFCTGPGTIPPFVCVESLGCEQVPLTCSSIEPCPRGQACFPTNCNGGSKRCFPLCPN